MIGMIILLCLNAVPHDQCTEDTAIDVIKPVDRYPTTMGCAIASMQALPNIEEADDTTHPVIHCRNAP
jgi:hypothetical protein